MHLFDFMISEREKKRKKQSAEEMMQSTVSFVVMREA